MPRYKLFLIILLISHSVLANALTIKNVSHNKNLFNPDKNETVNIRFRVDEPSFVTVFIYDARDILLTKISSHGLVSGDNTSITWNGRDQAGRIVPPEAYHYTLVAYTKSGDSIEYDVTDISGGEQLTVENIQWHKATKTIQYLLPAMARVTIRIGLKKRGPLLSSFLNWVPRIGGVTTSEWDGFDQSGLIDLKNHPNKEIGVLAFSLSKNTIIVGPVSNKVQLIQSFPWTVVKRIKKKKIKKRMFSHSQQAVEDRGDFPIIFKLPANLKKTKSGLPIITRKTALKLDLNPRDQKRLFAQRFESVFYIDGSFIEESELGTVPMTWYWNPSNTNPGIHYLTANIRAYEGNFGMATVKIVYQPEPTTLKQE